MDTQRIILMAAFAMVSLMLWQSWQMQINPPPAKSQEITSQVSSQDSKDVPNVPKTQIETETIKPTAVSDSKKLKGKRIFVKTDLLELEFDSVGADIRKVSLLDYPIDVNTNPSPVILMNDSPDKFFISQTGTLNIDSSKTYSPDHNSVFVSEKTEYDMSTEDSLDVSFTWTSEDQKLSVIKTYSFTKGDYAIRLNQKVINNTGQTWQGYFYRQLQRDVGGENSNMFIHTYTGGMLYREGGGFEKYSFDDMIDENLNKTMVGGWVAMIEHYFLAAWIPEKSGKENYYTRVVNQPGYDTRYIIGLTSKPYIVDDGSTTNINDILFVGPKLQNKLAVISPNLDDTVDYGFLSVIAHPIFWVLDKIHGFVQNWGWSIIFLTLFIKLIFYKLSEYSYRSMAQMRKVGPKMKAIQEQHKDNAQAKNQAMMKLYKTEKINPLGGCLPIVIQIPVFIALYWVLLESVELRQADFMLWINNLSAPDPFYVLPLIMGATMFIQQKLNPAPLDPIQAKVMMMLPIIFTVFFAFFPAGLVLYWVTNNVLSIAQQWYITRKIEQAP